jgi:hypothetical protein
MMTMTMLLLLLLAAAAPATASGTAADGGPLLPCGDTGSAGGDSQQVIEVFNFVKGVCSQVGESCPASALLPTSCATAECQRAVRLAADSCKPTFTKDGFLKTAFGGILDAAGVVCTRAHPPADENADGPAVRASGSCGAAAPHTEPRVPLP